MAPEVFEEHYSYNADIWSVGCVLYQMVTGMSPWQSLRLTNPVSLFNYVSNHDGPPPMDLPQDSGEDLVKALRRFMEKCFRKDPAQRPAARELLGDAFFFIKPYSDDDLSVSAAIFSPRAESSWETLQSPNVKVATRSTSPSPRRTRSANGSPFMSPPLPKRSTKKTSSPPITDMRSPLRDTSDWPTWARVKSGESATSPAQSKDTLCYTADSSGTPLFGLEFINSNS